MFRTYGPDEERREYYKRSAMESAYAFLKTQYGMTVNKVRGLGRATVYAFLSLLSRPQQGAAENIGRLEKAVSPTFFNT